MKKSMKIAIAAAAAVVLALAAVGAFMLIDRPAVPESPSSAPAVKAESPGATDAARAIQMRRRQPRLNDPRLLRTPADRRLAVPEPIRRPDFHGRDADPHRGNAPQPETRMDMTKRHNMTSVPPEITIDRAKAMTKEGRIDDAKKLLRNSILVERNPLNRKRLENELGSLANPDGAKSAPVTQGQVK